MDDEIESYTLENFPQYHQVVCNFNYHITKIDFMRWLILYQHGGIYADMDYICYENFFDDFTKEVAFTLSPIKNETYTNALMASSPEHKLIMDCANLVVENFNTKVYKGRKDSAPDLGVHIIDQILHKNPDYFNDVVQSLPVSIYNPSYSSYHRKEMKGAKGFHFLTGLWGKDDVDAITRDAKTLGISYEVALKRYFYKKTKIKL